MLVHLVHASAQEVMTSAKSVNRANLFLAHDAQFLHESRRASSTMLGGSSAISLTLAYKGKKANIGYT
jgi:hypothetical protein